MIKGCYFHTTESGAFIVFNRFKLLEDSHGIKLVRNIRAYGQGDDGQKYTTEGMAIRSAPDSNDWRINNIFELTIKPVE